MYKNISMLKGKPIDLTDKETQAYNFPLSIQPFSLSLQYKLIGAVESMADGNPNYEHKS